MYYYEELSTLTVVYNYKAVGRCVIYTEQRLKISYACFYTLVPLMTGQQFGTSPK